MFNQLQYRAALFVIISSLYAAPWKSNTHTHIHSQRLNYSLKPQTQPFLPYTVYTHTEQYQSTPSIDPQLPPSHRGYSIPLHFCLQQMLHNTYACVRAPESEKSVCLIQSISRGCYSCMVLRWRKLEACRCTSAAVGEQISFNSGSQAVWKYVKEDEGRKS